MALSRRIARPLLSSGFITSSVQVLKDPRSAGEALRPWVDRVGPAARSRGIPLPQDPVTLARATAALQLGAATALALGKAPRASAAVLTAAMVPTVLANSPWGADLDAATKERNLTETAKNASLVGGVLLAALDTEGRPGLAWRARRATRDARRQARHLAKETALEAKLATKSLT